jgi:stearoyl-CoA desaturase (delta-9 desaturase)
MQKKPVSADAAPPRASFPAHGVAAANAPFRRVEQRIALMVVLLPLLGFLAALVLLWEGRAGATEVWILAGMYVIGALGTEVGFHRLFTHRSFQTGRVVLVLLGVFGSMNAQGPILFWTAIHRRHHAFADRAGDPHSPYLYFRGEEIGKLLRGLYHAHVCWLFAHEMTDWGRYVPDLLKDRTVVKLNRLYLIWVALGLLLPAAAGALLIGGWAGAGAGLLWGGLARIFVAQQVTWGVNSLGHVYGSRPFRLQDRSTNNGWLALPSIGGSWHNNHHAFPVSAWHGLEWWQLDPAGRFISTLEACGLAWKVEAPTREMIEAKARGR